MSDEPVLEVIDQRGHGVTVTRQSVADALETPESLVAALRRVLK